MYSRLPSIPWMPPSLSSMLRYSNDVAFRSRCFASPMMPPSTLCYSNDVAFHSPWCFAILMMWFTSFLACPGLPSTRILFRGSPSFTVIFLARRVWSLYIVWYLLWSTIETSWSVLGHEDTSQRCHIHCLAGPISFSLCYYSCFWNWRIFIFVLACSSGMNCK